MNATETLLLKHDAAFEYVPDRLGIAAQIMSGLLAGQHAAYITDYTYKGQDVLDHSQLIADAVNLADGLIARIKETQK